MQPRVSFRFKVFMVLAVTLSVGLTSVARADSSRWIVIFLPGTNLGVQELLFELAGIDVLHTLSLINALAVQLRLGDTLDDLLTFLQGNLNVEGVFGDPTITLGPISIILPAATPPDEIYDWGQVRIGTPVVHQNLPDLQGAGVTIAVLDTGIDDNHPDLEPNVANGFNALPGGGSSDDDHGHGTHIAGIIAAASNQQGIIGVAPEATLVPVKVLDRNGAGNLSDVINGLQYVYNNRNSRGIKLVNMSLGFCTDREPMRRALERVFDGGLIMVAAAGNRLSHGGGAEEGGDSEGEDTSSCSDTTVRYPARYDEWVIAVAASDVNDDIAVYSLAGSEVDITGPGGSQANQRILSTMRGGGYGLGSGTSQAVAHVTGSIALALQRQPGLSFGPVRNLLQGTAFELSCCTADQQGAGLVDLEQMMETLP